VSAIAVATVTGIFSVLGIWIEVSRRQNKRDHDRGYGLLQSIDTRLINVDDKLDAHIADRDLHPERERA
jgi:hypothetical protein